MPDPISSLRNILTDPAGGPSGQRPAFGTQDMPGSKVSPMVDYPLEALQGALGVGTDTSANRFGAMAASAIPIVGGIKSAFTGGGGEALSGLRGALPKSLGPNAYAGPVISSYPSLDTVSDPLHLRLGAGTKLTPGGNVPLPPIGAGGLGDVPFMKPYPMPDTTTYPPYTASHNYDWPEAADSLGHPGQYDISGGPPKGFHGSTVNGDRLRSLGIPIPPSRSDK